MKPRPVAGVQRHAADGLAEAKRLFLQAEFHKALSALGGFEARNARERIEVALLRARSFLRLDEAAAAVRELEAVRRLPSSADDRVLVSALLGIAQISSDNSSGGERTLREAAREASGTHRAARAELAYYSALSRWMANDLDAAESALQPALEDGPDFIRARALELFGWIEISRERYGVAGRHFLEGLSALDDAKQVDVYLAAGMLQGASVVALETLDLALWRSIKPRLASLAGIEGAGRQRAFFLQSGAMLWLLEGDTGHAWQSLSDAEHAATSPVQRAAIALDRAFLARITGDRFSREQHLERAYQDLKREKWAVRTIEERMGLLDFVREASVDRANLAREASTRYFSSRERKNGTVSSGRDARVAAAEHHARGRLSVALGDTKAARRELRAALEAYGRLGYRMRQAIAGLDLHLTTRDAADLVIAAGASRLVPKSWVATEVRRREGASDDPVSQLSAAELRVLDQVKLAKTNRQIGKALGLSHHTVNNHLRKIYAAFGVGSRAAVAVRCAEQKRVR